MPTLIETAAIPDKRKAIIRDAELVLDQEVDAKGGLSGFAIKAAFRLVKGVKPGFIPEVIEALLDDFCAALQPFADEAKVKGKPVKDLLVANRDRAAEALLHITDDRAKKSKHSAVKATYDKLRPTAKRNVEDAMPRVGGLIEKYAA